VSDTSIRFALTDGAGLRALRWLGRIGSLLAAWPLWYAFFGKSELDWEALMVGGPGMLIALLLWGWAGHRLRHPRVCLEIDRQAGLARLWRGEGEPTICKLDELGAWTFSSWKTTGTSNGSRTVTTWHAARCAGLGEQNLYVDLSESACRSWVSTVDAAARGMVSSPKATTIGELLAARFDAAIAAASGTVATIGLTLLTGLCAFAAARQLARTDAHALEAAVMLALFFALLTLGWRAVRGPALAAAFAALSGIVFVAKPWFAPVTHELMGEVLRFSPTSETHLYYVIPGLGLCVLAAVMASMITIRKTTTPAPIRSEPAKLDPPRPQPPEPPSR
jgi:hypothetical protein